MAQETLAYYNQTFRVNLVYKRLMVKLLRADGGCLGTRRRRRTWKAAISFGELLTGFDPEISEWGNPAEFKLRHS